MSEDPTPYTSIKELSKTSVRYWLVLVSSLLVILLPLCAFPMSVDHVVFTRAGDCILQGGKIYKDFIDIKPPLFYYFYAAIRALFGSGEYGIRYADLLLQLGSCTWLAYVLLKVYKDKKAAFIAAVLYAFSYVVASFSGVMHPDTVAMPLFAALVLLVLREQRSALDHVFIGLCSGLVIGFKYTFGIVLPFVVVADIVLLKRSIRDELRASVFVIPGLVLGLLLSFFCFFDPEIRVAYAEVLSFLGQYTSHPPLNMAFVKTALKAQATYIGDVFSLSLVLLIIRAAASVLNTQTSELYNERRRQHSVIAVLLLMALFLWCSIIVEKKFIMNHFMRAYVPLMMLAGIGGSELLQLFRTSPTKSAAKKLVWSCVALLFLFFSPLPRWLAQLDVLRLYLTNPVAYTKLFEDESRISFEREQVQAVSRYIVQHRQPTDKTFVMGVGIISVYQEIHEAPWSRFGFSCFYFADDAPELWRTQMRAELQRTQWLVVATRDNNPVVTGHGQSSYESLLHDPAYQIVQSEFQEVYHSRSIKLYHRILSPGVH